MAGLASKFRVQPTDVKAAAMWGVTAATGALYLIQPWGWLKRTFLEKPEPEQNLDFSSFWSSVVEIVTTITNKGNKSDLGNMGSKWNIIWGVTIWKLWLWRNSVIFNIGEMKPMEPDHIILQVWPYYAHPSGDSMDQAASPQAYLAWTLPPEGWFKLNVDGAMSASQCIASCGGLIRDYTGKWVIGFAHFIGSCSAFEAEQWAIFKGLLIAWDHGCKKLILESDSKQLIDTLEKENNIQFGSLLILQIKKLLSRPWEVLLQYIPRERNKMADALAKKGLSKSLIYTNCPFNLRKILASECLGLNSH